MSKIEPGYRDYLLALLLAAATTTVLGVAQLNQGVMRDEATYFRAAELYAKWFEDLSSGTKDKPAPGLVDRQLITRYWSFNNEHPALFKTLAGLSFRLLHGYDGKHPELHPTPYAAPQKSLELLSEISAFRVPGWLITGLAVALIYLFGVRIDGRSSGLAAALLYITIPHVFFHGQLCCFDSAVTTMWLAVVYAYFRSLSEARWGIYAGLIFGLALATKHNAWFIPPLLLVHYLMVVWPDVSLSPLRLPRVPLVFVAMAILGPLVFLAHWPWLWFDTVKHLEEYFKFHLHHSYYNIEYLGVNLGEPPLPISYPFVMTLFTVPTILLVLALVGLGLYLKYPVLSALGRVFNVRATRYDSDFRFPAKRSFVRPGRGLDPLIGRLLALNALFPLVLIALPSTPHFGGTKHWLPAYPFICLLAGVALCRLVAGLPISRVKQCLVAALLIALCVAPGALNTAQTHPFGLSQYNALAGGPAGGADLGLNRQFWGYATRQLLPWMNKNLPTGARVYFHDTSYDSYAAYIRDGLLRPDIVYAGMERPAIDASDYSLVLHELHFNKYDYWTWEAYGTASPVKVLDLDGVPLASLYERPKTPTKRSR